MGERGGGSGDRELERRIYNVMQEGKDKVVKHWRSLALPPESAQQTASFAVSGCLPYVPSIALLSSGLRFNLVGISAFTLMPPVTETHTTCNYCGKI